MSERYYTRTELFEMLEVETDFVVSLERESIISVDAPPGSGGEFSGRMVERVRVAHNLVQDLEVNLAGVGIIVRMREELVAKRRNLERVLLELQRREG
ncbi:MAG: hypothetical protein JRH01_25205 [Deltaproteobacteria bacterium]|nr:hypothetical protein [Deltaproteobacteria bacterium]MBW2421862.1 hypothetical protein [Deltaproteobacteria bacterium]